MRPCGYLRVSSESQVENLSLATQERLILAHCEREGWPEPTLYIDAGKSAYNDDIQKRPRLAALVAAVQAGEHDTVVVYDLDRLARNAVLQLTLAQQLIGLGCRIVSLNQSTDLANPEGKLLFTFNAGINEFYSAQISRKSKAGLAHIRAGGGHVGGIPFGATRDADYRLRVDPALADALRLLLALAAEHSTLTVANRLNALGVAPPRRETACWRDTAIDSILRRGRWLLDQPEPWPTLYARAAGRPRLPRGRGAQRRRLLTGLLDCGCGGVLAAGGGKTLRDGTKIERLQCRNWRSGRPGGFGCPHPKVLLWRYEAAVERWLLGIPDLTRTVPIALPDVAAARRRLAERRRIAFKGLSTGGIEEREYDALIAALDAEEAALPLDGGGTDTIAASVAGVQRAWPHATPTERNDFLRTLGLRFVITGTAIEAVPRVALASFLVAEWYPLAFAVATGRE